MPVLNLICVVLAAVSGLQSLPAVKYTPAFLAPLLLAAVGAALLCGNVRAEVFMPLSPEERAQKGPEPRYRGRCPPPEFWDFWARCCSWPTAAGCSCTSSG